MKKTLLVSSLLALAVTIPFTASAAETTPFVKASIQSAQVVSPESFVLEKEPNGTPAEALNSKNEVRFYPLGAISSATDVDYYYLDSSFYSYSQRVTVTLTQIPKGKDYDLYAYNSSNGLVAKSTNSGNVDEQVSFVPVANATYYFKVVSANGYDAAQYYQINLIDAY